MRSLSRRIGPYLSHVDTPIGYKDWLLTGYGY